MTEQRTVNLSDLMNGAVFKQGRDDVGKPWPADYDRWSEFRQVSYELGRQYAAALGPRAAALYDRDGIARNRATSVMIEQLSSGSILG